VNGVVHVWGVYPDTSWQCSACAWTTLTWGFSAAAAAMQSTAAGRCCRDRSLQPGSNLTVLLATPTITYGHTAFILVRDLSQKSTK